MVPVPEGPGVALNTLTIEQYFQAAEAVERPVLLAPNTWWTCMECNPQGGMLARKRTDCPACKGNGGRYAPAPYVAKVEGRKEREAIFDLMSEIHRWYAG